MFKKDDRGTLIVVVSVCVLCCVIAFFLTRKNNVEKSVAVSEHNVFFSIVNYVNNYFQYIAMEDEEAVYSLLDNKYILENDITYDNVLEKVGNFSIDYSFSAYDMRFVDIKGNFLYFIKGKIYENTYYDRNLIDDDYSIIVCSAELYLNSTCFTLCYNIVTRSRFFFTNNF